MSFAIDLSDEQWELLVDLFDTPGRRGAPATILEPLSGPLSVLFLCGWRILHADHENVSMCANSTRQPTSRRAPSGESQSYSWHATVHLLAALFVFGGLPIACFIFARHFRRAGSAAWSIYSLFSGLAMLVAFAIYAAGTSGADSLEPMAGWLERASITTGFAWITLLAIHFLRSPAVSPRESHSQVSS